ncbi:hypothetical protein AXJ10_gp74 [Gordonia phage GordTnk2]|uniref:Uncharacterized protein n=1 Tax=Gordonia phage GordTnk2 TaxID=1622192 RepID=A0A0E3T6I6_9CAUD|nr:hypothetical protein AXJ10_gp74 [Gordonia phage GordTnk2]AKC02814.1 hypothetical protein GordTnk2_74 [Gordonia phage GordTnk2]
MSDDKNTHVCAEIQYGQAHSDICVNLKNHKVSREDRKFLHAALNDYLDHLDSAENPGMFYIGDKDLVQYNELGELTPRENEQLTRMRDISRRMEKDRRELAKYRQENEK